MGLQFDEAVTYVKEAGSFTAADATAKIEGARGWVNRAYIDFVRRTGCYAGSFTGAALTADTYEYDIPTVTGKTDILRLMHLYFTGGGTTRLELDPATPERIGQIRQGTPAQGVIYEYTTLGYNLLILGGPPATGDTLAGEYAKRPAVATGTAQFLVVPEEFHDAIPAGALALGLRYEGRHDEAADFERVYKELVADCLRDIANFRGYKPIAMQPSRMESAAGSVSPYWDRMGEDW